jgi:serine/threonine protein kinase/Tol biopolymer transport system component
MDPLRWETVETIFHKAISLQSEQRPKYLAEACRHDVALRQEIESLLSSFEGDAGFLEESAVTRGFRVLADQATLGAGDTFGAYEILSTLGYGGTGSVYLAFDTRLQRNVALKLLIPAVNKDREGDRRFKQEARVASRISHPNVAAIYEVGEFDRQQYIALEYVEGSTLRERLAKGAIPLGEAVEIVLQIGRAIEAAHALGIIHRDIKPENVMIRRDGYVKVLDFGLAKLTHAAAADHERTFDGVSLPLTTEPGLIMGTVNYMSPEQLRGQTLDASTDIWSWGVVLYEVLTSELPFKGATRSDIVAEILKEEPPRITKERPALPEQLLKILRRSLCKDRRDRYRRIGEPLNELRQLQRQLQIEDDGNILNASVSNYPTQFQSTLNAAAVESEKQNPAAFTSSHVVADNFRTIDQEQRDTLRSISRDFRIRLARNRLPVLAIIAAAAVISAIVAIRFRFWRTPSLPALQFTRLSIEGNVKEAVISPDGKYVASVVDEAGSRSVWIRQINGSGNLQVVPPSGDQYFSLSFSVDGDSLYYLQEKDGRGVLYQVPTLGGASRKLIENVDTQITSSGDGKQLAFIRQQQDGSALLICNADGSDVRTLALIKGPQSIAWNGTYSTGPAWSPDGAYLALPVTDVNDTSRHEILIARTKDGRLLKAPSQIVFSHISKVAWLSDNRRMLLIARSEKTSPAQLWVLFYPSGEVQKLTNDPNIYDGLSLTRNSQTALTTKLGNTSSMWIVDTASGARQIPFTNFDGNYGVAWTPDGRIVYSHAEGGTSSLWVMNLDGSNRKQLTFDRHRDVEPAISPNGRYVVFVSYGEDGKPHLWRIETDGTGVTQLTGGAYEDTPSFLHDSSALIYQRGDADGLWKVSVGGGTSTNVVDGEILFSDVSPDGKLIAGVTPQKSNASTSEISILSTQGGRPIKTFSLPASFTPVPPGIRWSPDGLSVTYVLANNGVANIWRQPLSGGLAKQITNFSEGRISYFSWSSSGQLAITRGIASRELVIMSNLP